MPAIGVEARLSSSGDGDALAWTEILEDPRDALDEIRTVMADNVAERFATLTDPWGQAWAPTSITTIEIRLRQGKDPIAVRFVPLAVSSDGGRALRINFGRNPLPQFFHDGNAANRVFGRALGPRPPRPILPLTSSGVELPSGLRTQIVEAFSDGIREGVRRRSGGG